MATAKKVAPKAAKTTKIDAAPAKAVKPTAKAPVKKAGESKVAKAVAKLASKITTLTARKNDISADIKVLKDQRAALKAPATPVAAPVAAVPIAKRAPGKKAAAPVLAAASPVAAPKTKRASAKKAAAKAA